MERINLPLRKWLIALAAIVLTLYLLSRTVTEFLWFAQMGQPGVYTKLLGSQFALSVLVGVASFALAWFNLRYARRRGAPASGEHYIGQCADDFIDKEMVEEHVDRGILIASAVVGLVYLVSSLGRARLLLEWSGAQAFGIADPQFGRDIGFYVFRLPFYAWILHWLGSVGFLATLLTAVAHFYHNRVFLSGRTVRIIPGAREHLGILVAALLLVKAAGYWLEQYGLVLSVNPVFAGAGYTDLQVRLPMLRVLMVLCVMVAAAVVVLTRRDVDMKRPGYALAGLIAIALLSRGATAFVQGVIVAPDEQNKQAPYIERSIAATRTAFLLDDIESAPYEIDDRLTLEDVLRHPETLDSVRLWDHRPLLATYAQQEQIKPYYSFTDVDVDRYRIDGRLRQVMIAPRELYFNGLAPEARTWVNQHITYTHGYGVAMSPVNKKTREGWPVYLWSGIPPKPSEEIGDSMTLERPGIYFGEFAVPETHSQDVRSRPPGPSAPPQSAGPPRAPGMGLMARPPAKGQQSSSPIALPAEYVLTGSGGPGVEAEFDYPLGEDNRKTAYSGRDGVRVGSAWRRLLFAIRFRDPKLFFTPVHPEAKVLMYRHVVLRAQRLMPYLAFDTDPYVMIGDDGGLKWVVDAYSYTSRYPYSAPQPLEYYGWNQSIPVNYARNSVKVVIDSYDGSVSFYRVDEKDPIAACYAKLFPTLFRPASEIPDDVKRHLRFPRSMFLWQTRALEVFHMRDPYVFYTKEDKWGRPQEIFGAREEGGNGGDGWQTVVSEPYYVLLPRPDSEKLEFMMIMPLVPLSRPNMAAWLGSWWDEDSGRGRSVLYKFPKDTSVYGPMQIENRIDQDPDISRDLTLWNRGGSQVIRGNLIALPIEKTILWIEPIYIQGAQDPFPSLKRVVVVFGGRAGTEGEQGSKVAMAATFDEALRLALAKANGDAKPTEGQTPPPAAQPEPPAPASESSAPATGPDDDALSKLADFLARSEEQRMREATELKELREMLETAR